MTKPQQQSIEYSQKALEARDRGRQRYALASVRTRGTWLLLSGITVLLSALLGWGVFGGIAESVTGTGITLLNGGMRPIVASGSGMLSHLNISPGARLDAEQVVGQVYSPESLFQVQKLEAEYAAIVAETEFLSKGHAALLDLQQGSLRDREKHLQRLLTLQEQSKKRAEELARMYATLNERRAIPKGSYFQALDQTVQTESAFLSVLFQAADMELTIRDRLWQHQQRLTELRHQEESKRRELELARRLYREGGWLTAGFDGQVLEVFREEGAYVRPGDVIALVGARMGGGLHVNAYIPADEGKKVRNGMSAFFSPAAAPSAEFGYIRAVVREVSAAPTNLDVVEAELLNKALAQQVMGRKTVMRVVLELVPDADSTSGFRWTSRRGWAHPVVNGMLGTVIINTGWRSPASWVIPLLRTLLDPEPVRPDTEAERQSS